MPGKFGAYPFVIVSMFFCFCFFFFINMSTCSIFHSPDVNFDELARCTDDYNGAMLKAVCVEAVRWTF